jgi:outer membrane protein insertion porin family
VLRDLSYLGICFIIFFHGTNVFANTRSAVVSLLTDDSFDKLSYWLPEPISIKKVICDADIALPQDEFSYLVDIPDNTTISADDLKNVCKSLQKKNKFRIITFSLQSDDDHPTLYIFAEALWTFNKIKFHGSMVGKDIYRQYYLLESTEPFDVKKHNHFLKNIRQAFYDNGYLNAQVADYLDYDQKTKSVTVNLVLNPDVCFIIDHVTLSIVNEVYVGDDNVFLIEKLTNHLRSQLINNYYAAQLINQEKNHIKDALVKEGFLNSNIEIQEGINPNNKTCQLHFKVKLGEKKQCVFSGNHFFNKDELRARITIFNNTTFLLPPHILTEELIRAYQKNGFWFVKIETKEEEGAYHFMIDEGSRASIGSIALHGVESFDRRNVIRRSLSAVKKNGYFDAEILKQSLADLISFYIKEGFWDCSILKQDYIPLKKENSYALEITIDEGRRRYLSSIAIPQFPELLEQWPFNLSDLPKPFDLSLMQEQKQWLLDYFSKQGYLYVQVKPEINQDDAMVSVVWYIDTKELVRFGKTIIVGNSSFPFKVLEKHLLYQQGEPWNKEKLDQSLVRLRQLNIFETIHIYPDLIAQSETDKAVIIKLVDDDSVEVRIRGGFQQVSKNLTFRSGTTYKVGGSLLYKNPFNVGDYSVLNADVTRFYRYLSGTYVRPWSFGLPLTTVLKGYSNKYTQPVRIGIDKPLYRATQQGALIGMSYAFQKTDLGVNFGFEMMETKGLSRELAQAINFEPALIDVGVPYFYLEPNIFIDCLDDKLNPTCGSLTAIAFKGMFSWKRGSVNFFKILFEQSFFVPLNPLVLAMRIRFGHIFNQKLRAVMPPERFYLGGENSLRGYEIDLAPPLGLYIEDDGKKYLVPQGGKSMVNGNIEFRFPFYKNFGGTIFQDFGILVEDSWAEIKGNKLLAATGLGLRYNTPIGPLRLDIGWKWKRQKPEDSSFAWFLTLGNAF